jgi:hypothetical protein
MRTCININELPFRYESLAQPAGDRHERRFQFEVTLSDGQPVVMSLVDATLQLVVRDSTGAVILTQPVTPDSAATGMVRLAIDGSATSTWRGLYQADLIASLPVGSQLFPSGGTRTLVRAKLEYKEGGAE